MDVRIKVVLALIDRDLRAKHEPTAMAQNVRLSVSRFYDLFRNETGTVPARYIRDLRLQQAKGLLLGSHLSVKEIANSVGIQDVSHFVRDFEKRYGLSPRRFRLAHGVLRASGPFEAAPENSLINSNWR